jgi:HD-GYP domain-containing protein (c-di-GMP phosphodiesterase class II)
VTVAAPAPASPEPPEPQELDDEEVSAIEILAGRVGAEMGMSAEELKDLATAAKFRDLGMATVPDEIITKLGPLTDDEWAIVRSHPQRSAEMLGAGPAFDRARAIIRANHEHLDGTGYPNGLAGAEIPTGSRILLVVESYVAMTEDRPYRNHLGANAAIEHFEQHAGAIYDADAVSALARVLRHRRMSAAA